MTRKDYEKFAKLLSKDKTNFAGYELDALNFIQAQIADIFAQDNPRFDRKIFYVACEPEKN